VVVRRITGGDWVPKTTSSGTGAELVAYNCVVLGFDLLSTFMGVCALLDGTMTSLFSSVDDRLYAYSALGSTLCAVTAAFEAYNTFVSAVMLPQGPALVAHHAVTLLLCGIATAPYCHAYLLFFFGIANLSSISLAAFTICDILRARYPAFEAPYNHLRTAFGLSFLVVRTGAWPVLSARFWMDSYIAVRVGRVHSYLATTFLLLSNIFLTGLQFMWGRKVWQGLLKVVMGRSTGNSSAGKGNAGTRDSTHTTTGKTGTAPPELRTRRPSREPV